MSRRESRDSESRRNRSRFDREPSPKRSRRDGKPTTEREPSNSILDSKDNTDRDLRHRRRLQDAIPLEASSQPDSKEETDAVSKESDKKLSGHDNGTKSSLDPTEVSRSRSYFQQHDERGSAARIGRSSGRRTSPEHGWRDSKDQHDERTISKTAYDTRQRDEKSQAKRVENKVWHHDGFFELEADPPLPPPPPLPTARKRPAFREKKIAQDPESTEKSARAQAKLSRQDHHAPGSERKEERGPHHFDKPERQYAVDRASDRGESKRDGFAPRDRYNGGGNYRGRDRFSGRQGYRTSGTSGTRVEKWKHDLFDEANRSPDPKNEEDQIAKVEALLSM